MSAKKFNLGYIGVIIGTAIAASLCCITPILAIITGAGSLVANLSVLQPFRPYLIGLVIIALGLAWFQYLRPAKETDCGCNTEDKSFLRSKQFLVSITIFSLLIISFPSYSRLLFQSGSISSITDQDTSSKLELMVTGMTCTSCELHIENEVKKLPGISFVKASYEKNNTIIRYDETKVNKEKIIEAINSTGYKVNQSPLLIDVKEKNESCCSSGTCKEHKSLLPQEENRDLKVMKDLSEIQNFFNQRKGKTKFVAILSSTCGWCIEGANAINQTVIENIERKNIEVLIIWTNMVKTDDLKSAYKAASLFRDTRVSQYFDSKNDFGDLVAKRLSPTGASAWDIYMFFDNDVQWNESLPRPFDYAHQLSPVMHPWVDKTKYFCGQELTNRLKAIVSTL